MASGKTSPIVWIGIAGAAVVATSFALFMFRGKPAPEASAPTPPVAAVEPAASPSPAVTPPASAAAAAAGVATPPAAPPATGATAAAAGRKSAPSISAASSPAPAAPAGGKPADDPLITFPDVKLYQVSGKRASDQDAVLNFAAGQLLIMPKRGGAAMATLSYARITHATYVHARDPKWSSGLAAPPDDLDVGSFIRTPRHWLVLQGADHFEILRLDDGNFSRVMDAFEARTGVKIDRQK